MKFRFYIQQDCTCHSVITAATVFASGTSSNFSSATEFRFIHWSKANTLLQ